MIRHFFAKDMRAVVQAYNVWQPSSKPLRELQWRMSPMAQVQVSASEVDAEEDESSTLNFDDGEATDTLHPSVVTTPARAAKL